MKIRLSVHLIFWGGAGESVINTAATTWVSTRLYLLLLKSSIDEQCYHYWLCYIDVLFEGLCFFHLTLTRVMQNVIKIEVLSGQYFFMKTICLKEKM